MAPNKNKLSLLLLSKEGFGGEHIKSIKSKETLLCFGKEDWVTSQMDSLHAVPVKVQFLKRGTIIEPEVT